MKFSREIKVGILITSALAALLWGMNYLKGVDLFSGNNKYYAVYDQVDGLVPSSRIILNGVRVGQVQNIHFMPGRSGKIVATLLIRNDVQIGNESVARIISSDLLGGRVMDIKLDHDSPPLQSGDTLKTEVVSTFTEQVQPIKDKAESLIESLDTLAQSLNKVFSAEATSNLSRTLESLRRASESLDEMTAPPGGKLRLMIANIESITSNIRDHNEELSNILKNISSVSDSLAGPNVHALIRDARTTLVKSDSIFAKINRGEGSLGLLVNDDSLYNALARTSAGLNKLIIDLKENPGKYLHFSVFGKKSTKPKP